MLADPPLPNAGNLLNEVLNGAGGLSGLTTRFERCGLGEHMRSWIGDGENSPITPAQIEQVIPADRLDALARTHGFAPGTVAIVLAQLLPHAVQLSSAAREG